jgi:uncharacterized membrane protein YfcA
MDAIDPSSLLIFAIVATFVFAGLVKGLIGLGLPTLAMGLLGLVMPPAQAAALLIAPALVTNFWQLAAGRAFWLLVRRLWLMMAGVCVGTWLGAGFLAEGAVEHTRLAIAVVLLLYSCMGLLDLRLRVSPRAEPWLSPVVGLTTGVLTGATGIFVVPAVPYIQALGLNKDELVQALALAPTVSAIALGVSLADRGSLGWSLAMASGLAVVPALLGMYCGQVV